ncbi:AIPR family protein [Amedibacillus sp. YH-ame10]
MGLNVKGNKSSRLMEQFLEEKKFQFEDKNKKKTTMAQAQKNLNIKKIVTYHDLNLSENDNYVAFFRLDDCSDQGLGELKINIEKMCKIGNEENNFDLYYLVVFVSKHSQKVKAEQWVSNIRTWAKKAFGCKSVTNIAYYVIQDSQTNLHEFTVGIDSRLLSISMPYRKEEYSGLPDHTFPNSINSYVFTANLYDIVNMYDHVSDSLFSKNVRYKIRDVLDVESNITKTLNEQPEAFWYLNNGITIIVKDKQHFNLNKQNSIAFQYFNDGDISIINGAQTISTAANFFLSETSNETDVERAKRLAKVLLRVVCLKEDKADCKHMLDDISISLNRQKPITIEDIAYTNPHILEINQLCKNCKDPYHFYVSKRGEETLNSYVCSISDLARACMAYYFQKPSAARTKSTQEIVEEIFNCEAIKDQNMSDIFDKIFKPVNFCIALINVYNNYSKTDCCNVAKDENINVILKNGRYYFAAYVIVVLNGENSDYTNFQYDITKINESLYNIIGKYIQLVIKSVENNNIRQLSSNDFKNDTLYKKLNDHDGFKSQLITYFKIDN